MHINAALFPICRSFWFLWPLAFSGFRLFRLHVPDRHWRMCQHTLPEWCQMCGPTQCLWMPLYRRWSLAFILCSCAAEGFSLLLLPTKRKLLRMIAQEPWGSAGRCWWAFYAWPSWAVLVSLFKRLKLSVMWAAHSYLLINIFQRKMLEVSG